MDYSLATIEDFWSLYKYKKDPRILSYLYEYKYDELLAVALRICRNHTDAEDALQESMTALLNVEEEKLIQIKNIKSWLKAVIANKSKKLIERESRLRQRHQIGFEITQPKNLEDTQQDPIEYFDFLREGMESLPEATQSALHLFYINGMSWSEVGERLNKSEEAVRKQAQRGMKKMRGYFKSKGLPITMAFMLAMLLDNRKAMAQSGPANQSVDLFAAEAELLAKVNSFAPVTNIAIALPLILIPVIVIITSLKSYEDVSVEESAQVKQVQYDNSFLLSGQGIRFLGEGVYLLESTSLGPGEEAYLQSDWIKLDGTTSYSVSFIANISLLENLSSEQLSDGIWLNAMREKLITSQLSEGALLSAKRIEGIVSQSNVKNSFQYDRYGFNTRIVEDEGDLARQYRRRFQTYDHNEDYAVHLSLEVKPNSYAQGLSAYSIRRYVIPLQNVPNYPDFDYFMENEMHGAGLHAGMTPLKDENGQSITKKSTRGYKDFQQFRKDEDLILAWTRAGKIRIRSLEIQSY